jgi:hypothetical protein
MSNKTPETLTKKYELDLTKIPELEKDEPIYKYQARLQRYLIYYKYEKKKKILTFINNWYKMKPENNKYNNFGFEDLRQFKNQLYNMMPNNEQSKAFLIKNFEIYNKEFNLELEYDENLFTTYNLLYFIKLMCKKIDADLKKEVIRKIDDNKKIKIDKKYTIIKLN